jgi:hypothetical protein
MDIIHEFITMRKMTVLRMQVPYFIRIACRRVYEEEEQLIVDYCDFIEENGTDLERVIKEFKNDSNVEYFYEDVDIYDLKEKKKV